MHLVDNAAQTMRLPSPSGRRCPEGADEGTGEASHIQVRQACPCRRTLTPTPLPVGEGLERYASMTPSALALHVITKSIANPHIHPATTRAQAASPQPSRMRRAA